MYDLHQLGWYSFQQLSLTVAREVFGQSSMSFLGSNDGGRDGCFVGRWIPTSNKNEIMEGQFVFQCKFTSQANYNLKLSDLKDELPKAKVLVENGLCDIYILITNAGISGRLSEKIQTTLKSVGVKNILVFGADWLTQTINENKRLRRLVPRIYGLGDLSQILDERVYLQGKMLLASLKEELAKVVITGSYQKAAKALDKYGFVLLIGEPAAGKTTIASLLAMGALDQWGASTLKLDTADQVVHHWNPDDPFQFFWIDDAFGVTQYESNLVQNWNHRMPEIKAMIKNGSKFVMTSRDYIYNRARADLKEGAFPMLKESQVVIDVHNLTLIEKRQMLYNHIKLGTQPIEFRKKIKPFLEYIAGLSSFIPETARRLASPFFTKNLYIYEWHLEEFVTKMESFLVEVLDGLDKDSQATLALIYMSNDNLPSPINPKKVHQIEAIKRMGSSLGGCSNALNAMRGNLVQFVYFEDNAFWKFKHPTIGDAFAIHVAQSPELIEVYLQGSQIEKLLNQITCGDVGIEKAIIVPKAFFLLILDRLNRFTSTKSFKSQYLAVWGAKRQLHQFLSNRCSGEFLIKYLESNPTLLEHVTQPGLNLDSVSEVDLACRLHHFNLLPESHRLKFIETVSSYAIKGEDLYALRSSRIRKVFKEEELINLRKKVKDELIPEVANLTKSWQGNYDSTSEADAYMDSLIDIYKTLEEEFKEDSAITDVVKGEIQKVKNWIEENTSDEQKVPKREKLSDAGTVLNVNEERSIFDDIDVI